MAMIQSSMDSRSILGNCFADSSSISLLTVCLLLFAKIGLFSCCFFTVAIKISTCFVLAMGGSYLDGLFFPTIFLFSSTFLFCMLCMLLGNMINISFRSCYVIMLS